MSWDVEHMYYPGFNLPNEAFWNLIYMPGITHELLHRTLRKLGKSWIRPVDEKFREREYYTKNLELVEKPDFIEGNFYWVCQGGEYI
jgi:hypothetical protein